MIDPYDTLGVSRGAANDDVKKSYRAIIRSLNLAPTGPQSDLDRFALVRAAYEHVIYGKPFVPPTGPADDIMMGSLDYDVSSLMQATIRYRDAVHAAYTTYRTANDAIMTVLLKEHGRLSEAMHKQDLKLHSDMSSLGENVLYGTVDSLREYTRAMDTVFENSGLKPDDQFWLARTEFEKFEERRPLIWQNLLAALAAAKTTYQQEVRALA